MVNGGHMIHMMRIVLLAACLACSGLAGAQAQRDNNATDKSEHSTGSTLTPETKGQLQPQGRTGPIDTGGGGAPPESPQGQSPPGMQAAPEGSSKNTVAPDKK
jgi:hypothetical protein